MYDLFREKMVDEFEKEQDEQDAKANIPKIKDSGNRREFDTGAVRDISEGKGRCDLLPLGAICDLIPDKHLILGMIEDYIRVGSVNILGRVFKEFSKRYFENVETAILEASIHFEQGCQKYGERNWEKGIPLHCYMDSAVRHYLKFQRGDTDERHDRAFIWNILCAIWTHENKPELNDLPWA